MKHLYLLLPVVDNSKHYWIDDSELEKMFRIGEGWLEQHPRTPANRPALLGHRNSLLNEAEERFKKLDEDAGSDNAGVAAETVLPGLDLPAIEATIDQTGDAMGEEPPDPSRRPPPRASSEAGTTATWRPAWKPRSPWATNA